MDDIILGIDLGTTNSEVAILRDGQPFVIPGEDGNPILPSVVGLADDGRLLVGQPARNQFKIAPERTIKSVKRRMGEETLIKLGDQEFRPQEISAVILRSLKNRAERHLGRSVRKAVITVPAYFNDSQRQATREAGQLAGLDVVRIINEPTAAALTYQPKPAGTERILVYDLGGGTFDVSIVQCEGGVFEVLASHGDTHLGGDDFDELLLDHIAEDFLGIHDVDPRDDPRTRNRLLYAVEEAKKQLSDHPFARIEEEFISEKNGVPLHLNYELDRQDFERLIRPLLDKTLACIQKSLEDAKLTPSQLTRVVLVGGSTRSPLISRLIEERLGQLPHREIHPDLCVAMGAGIQGAIVAGQPVGSVLVDITPHTLGIKCLDVPHSFIDRPNEFRFAPIVRRNSPLPSSQSEVFCTVFDNQPIVEIDVYQGEHDDVRMNHRVGKFMIEGLARAPAGNQLVVQLDLTLDGTLKVSAREKATGLLRQITIDNAQARFALEERDAAQQRLNRLWELPQEESVSELVESEIRETLDERGARDLVQARALLEKADRIRAKAVPDDRIEIDRLVAAIRSAIEEARWDDLTHACGQLSDVLFYLEDA